MIKNRFLSAFALAALVGMAACESQEPAAEPISEPAVEEPIAEPAPVEVAPAPVAPEADADLTDPAADPAAVPADSVVEPSL